MSDNPDLPIGEKKDSDDSQDKDESLLPRGAGIMQDPYGFEEPPDFDGGGEDFLELDDRGSPVAIRNRSRTIHRDRPPFK